MSISLPTNPDPSPGTVVIPPTSVGSGSGNAVSASSISTSHKVLVGVLFLVVVLVILTEAAGESHEWAMGIGLLLMGPLLIEGMNNSARFASWAGNNPFNPNTTS